MEAKSWREKVRSLEYRPWPREFPGVASRRKQTARRWLATGRRGCSVAGGLATDVQM